MARDSTRSRQQAYIIFAILAETWPLSFPDMSLFNKNVLPSYVGPMWGDQQTIANKGSKYHLVPVSIPTSINFFYFQIFYMVVVLNFFSSAKFFRNFFWKFSKIIQKISVIILQLPKIILQIFQNNFLNILIFKILRNNFWKFPNYFSRFFDFFWNISWNLPEYWSKISELIFDIIFQNTSRNFPKNTYRKCPTYLSNSSEILWNFSRNSPR